MGVKILEYYQDGVRCWAKNNSLHHLNAFGLSFHTMQTKMRFFQNTKVLQIIICLLLLVSGLTFMSKTKTEVKISKTLTILNSVQSENEDLKEEISELEKHITKLKAASN